MTTDLLTRQRKLAFAALTVALVFVLIEGVARLMWSGLERRAFAARESAGREILRNDAIAFMKVADGRYGYLLKPDFRSEQVTINGDGFAQKETVPLERVPGFLRVACLGESTTFGSDSVTNYPSFLRAILQSRGGPVEMINAGVPGWVSDQVALRAELQVAAYKPDVVILYVGWNDFQSYDPLGPEAAISYFEFAYKGRTWKQETTTWLRSVALLSAAYHREDPARYLPTGQQTAGGHYKFLIQNLDRIVRAFRAANPNTAIFVSTLVGRWPAGTAEEWKQIAPVWWMTKHDVSLDQAAILVNAFNDQLRSFARSRNVHLADSAAAFESLDRARLQSDWAHMTADGYELLAWAMFDAMVRDRVVSGSADAPRADALRSQYAMTRPIAAAGVELEAR